MPRKRDIKPGFFQNEDLGSLPPLYRLMFVGLWCWADREGRLQDRPKRLKAEILPYDNCDGEEIIEALAINNFIVRYEVSGEKYIQIANFKKHQNVHPSEASSVIPEYVYIDKLSSTAKTVKPNLGTSCDTVQKNAFPSYTSFPSSPSLDNMPAPGDAGESEIAPAGSPAAEAGGAQNIDSGKGKKEYTEGFNEFWAIYPRKAEKSAAFGKWKARLREKVPPADLIKAARNYAEKCRHEGAEERFIKQAKTFLGENKPYEEYVNGIPKPETMATGNGAKSNKATFNNFTNRTYDAKALEEAWLKASK